MRVDHQSATRGKSSGRNVEGTAEGYYSRRSVEA